MLVAAMQKTGVGLLAMAHADAIAESDEDSAELVCKPQPKKPKTQRKPKVPVTTASVKETCAAGDAYVASVLGTEGVDASALLFCIISRAGGPTRAPSRRVY